MQATKIVLKKHVGKDGIEMTNCREKRKTHLLFVKPLSLGHSFQIGITIHKHVMPIQASQITSHPGDLVSLEEQKLPRWEHKKHFKTIMHQN